MKKVICVVEDEKAINDLVNQYLKKEGYEVRSYYTYEEASAHVGDDDVHLWILDIMLDDKSGFDLIEEIRLQGKDIPVIFMSARDKEFDRIIGLEKGSDDYITKPFSIQILKRRVEAVLRRGRTNSNDIYFDDGFLRLDFQALTAVRSGEKLNITPNEYKLLRLLTANAGNIVTRQTLLEKLWDCDENYIDDHTLTVTMNRLRAKIEEEGHSYIRTVRGMGYIWTGGK